MWTGADLKQKHRTFDELRVLRVECRIRAMTPKSLDATTHTKCHPLSHQESLFCFEYDLMNVTS